MTLSRRRFVLPSERAVIKSFNVDAHENHKIRTEVLPEPYLGHPDAEIFLLNLNPGYSETTYRPKDIGGSGWWQRKLRMPIEIAGRQTVARKMCCVEYFPYLLQELQAAGADSRVAGIQLSSGSQGARQGGSCDLRESEEGVVVGRARAGEA